MTLPRPLLSIFGLAVVIQLAFGIEYTDNGVAIVGTTEPLDINVVAGTSREDLISYEFASYIAVHFAGFNLPDGDSVVIISPDDNSTISHTYTGRGRDQSGTFIASFIPGNSVTVTYNSVGTASTGQGYRITGFSRGYPTMDQESICGSGDQSLPAKCYAPGTNLSEGLPQAYKKAQAVARLLINGTYLCTGWLAGSEGHLFTNHHCFEQEEWALNTDFEFAAESSSCSDQCETQLGCAGTVVATTSTFIADSEDIDYSVVQLPDCVDLSPYGYLQFRESGPVMNESIYVPQHPDGYAKRIASTVDNGSPATILSVGLDGSCGTEQVGHDADTQGGSSGSPLMSTSDNLVVAIHHCGGCANAAIDVRTVLTDLASKNITIANLVASEDDAGQSDPPSFARTPCSAQSSKNFTHAGNHTMPCSHPTKQGSSKTALKTAASNTTSSAVSAASKTTSSPTPAATKSSTSAASPVGTVAALTNSPLAAGTMTSSKVTTSKSTSATTSATSKKDSKGGSTSSSVSTSTSTSKTALTSASVVTSTKATKASSTPGSSVTSSSSSKTTSTSSVSSTSSTTTSTSTATSSSSSDCDSTAVSTSSSPSTASTVDNNTIVGKLKTAVVGPSYPAPTYAATKTGLTHAFSPKPTTPTPASTRASVAPPVSRSPATPSPTTTSTPRPSVPATTTSTVATPAPTVLRPVTPSPTSTLTTKPPTPTPASTTSKPSPTPASTASSTPKPTTPALPAATPAATTTSSSTVIPKPTPASTSVESNGSSGWGDVEQN